ncbi:MAG: hypothetical protein ACYTGQ_11435 [Planctomycetota bacterium]
MHEQRPCLDDLGHWTLLTGSDEAALAGADRLIRTLIEDTEDADTAGETKSLGVMAMGCGEATARGVVERLNGSLSDLLDQPIEALGHCQKMRPVNRRFIGRFPCDAGAHPWGVFRDFFGELEWVGDEAMAMNQPETDDDFDLTASASVMEELEGLGGFGVMDANSTLTAEEIAALNAPGLEDEPPATPVADEPEALIDPEPQQVSEPEPGAMINETAAPLQAEVEMNIVAEIDTVKLPPPSRPVVEHVYRSIEPPKQRGPEPPEVQTPPSPPVTEIKIPAERADKPAWPQTSGAGMNPVQSAEPQSVATATQTAHTAHLANDAHGAAVESVATTPGPDNLAGFVDDLAPVEARCPRQEGVQIAVGADGGLHLLLFGENESADASIRRLIEVRAWAGEHAQLLRLACRERAVDVSIEPEAHLFASQPRNAAGIAYAGSPTRRPMRLHLLKPITVGPTTVWVHEPLN